MKTEKPPLALPLRVVYVEGCGHRVENQVGVVITRWLFKHEAEYIARAVNCHEEMAEACKDAQHLVKEIEASLDSDEDIPFGIDTWLAMVRTKMGNILAKVK